jgi:hypothetical protein
MKLVWLATVALLLKKKTTLITFYRIFNFHCYIASDSYSIILKFSLSWISIKKPVVVQAVLTIIM